MADIQISTTTGSTNDSYSAWGMWGPYWTSEEIGVMIGVDANADVFASKTTDGGDTWGAAVVLEAGLVRHMAAVFGPEMGFSSDKVYVAYVDDTGNDYTFAVFDISDGTWSAAVGLNDSATVGTVPTNHAAGVTVSLSGKIYVLVQTAAAVAEGYVSSNGGTSFSTLGAVPSGAGTALRRYVPLYCNTDDDDDVAFLMYTENTGNVTVEVYDASAGTWHSTAVWSGLTPGGFEHKLFDAKVRLSTGVNYAFAWNIEDNVAADVLGATILVTSTSPTVTALSNPITNLSEAGCLAVFFDQNNDIIDLYYVNGTNFQASARVKRISSSDLGVTWGSASNFDEAGEQDYRMVSAGFAQTFGRRMALFMVNDTAIYTNTVNAVDTLGNGTVTLTGSLVPTNTEDTVAAGGATLIATLSAGTWDSTIDDDAVASEDFIAALVSAGTELLGWNAIVVGKNYRKEVLADTPISYLRLGGNVTDAGSAGINGVATALTVGGPLLLSSAQASSVFNAATAKVQLVDASAIQNIFDGGGSAEVIIEPWASGFSQDISRVISKIDGGAGWELILDNQSAGFVDISFRQDFSTQQGVWKLAGKIPVGFQTHVVVTYNASSASNDPTFWINGVAYTTANGVVEETTPSGTYSSDASSDIWIGSNSSAAVTFNGRMQEFALYGSALTEARILAHLYAASYAYGLKYSNLARTSSTVITVTMPAFPFYDINVLETITATFPNTTHSGPGDLVATPTFNVTPTTRKTNFTPQPNVRAVGPFGLVNGGLGPSAGDAFRRLGAGDIWQVGSPEMAVGLEGTDLPRILLVRATEITEL